MPPSYPTLPTLSDEELVDLFDDDLEAIRRYRLLHAVLVDGVSQREAAKAHNVSERTVRNVLGIYRRGAGLDTLRSRRATTRRAVPRRWESFEPALAAALAEDAMAGGDKLWRRAQALMGDAGASLSRRTAYRILARLRAEAKRSEEPTLFGAVRNALPLLLEDPPLSLGASTLAQRILPDESNQLLRGTLLQQALRASLDRLRPAGAVSTIDRSWWPYLICSGEYEAGQPRADLQNNLALSASTYSRAKRQGLIQIANLLPRIIAPMIEAPTVLASQRLPRTPDFVGRREEQSYYAWRLQTEGFAYIWGVPGSGKTALAAELAAEGRRYGQMILWHTCRVGPESMLLGIIDGLAQALASTGDETLWRELRQTPPEARDAPTLLDQLRERLQVRPAVVVIDDFQRVADDEGAPLIKMLNSLVARRSVRMVIAQRVKPEHDDWPQLPGLSEREARLLWAGLPALSDEQWKSLHAATGGLPHPLRRIAAAYRRAGEMARPDDWKAELENWIQDEFWDRLSDNEQRLVTITYALHGRPWASHAPLMLAAFDMDQRSIARLQNQGLIEVADSHATVHPVLHQGAAARVREDTGLRALLNALAATIMEAAPVDIDDIEVIAELESNVFDLTTIEFGVPAGLELLTRVREALEHSAAYLERNGDDNARKLVAELATLKAALPDPTKSFKTQRAAVRV